MESKPRGELFHPWTSSPNDYSPMARIGWVPLRAPARAATRGAPGCDRGPGAQSPGRCHRRWACSCPWSGRAHASTGAGRAPAADPAGSDRPGWGRAACGTVPSSWYASGVGAPASNHPAAPMVTRLKSSGISQQRKGVGGGEKGINYREPVLIWILLRVMLLAPEQQVSITRRNLAPPPPLPLLPKRPRTMVPFGDGGRHCRCPVSAHLPAPALGAIVPFWGNRLIDPVRCALRRCT